ncbi:hypothetical protein GOBAR_AA15326 [Gossypium barbadense]|uniref:SAP30-binding protein n=1 Tax=Gossypium barbadense TaxID=3634 RepID=A0A2P5XPQ0_GOSBA|nr:hypothetical protein GOBAR_AA15326 [Gossypium barbadense]
MASRKKESEGIALLSMYNDEDDEEMGDIEEDSRTNDNTPPFPHQNTILSQQQQEPSVSSPQQPQTLVSSKRSGGGRLTIVDYGHDEAAMSPEPEEGELGNSDDLMIGIDQQNANRKIDKFLNLKRAGKSFNAEVRNRKDYRNPDFLLHAVRYQDIDQIGSCFSKDVFDPHGYDKSDFYDEIEADMKCERERKEQESKKNQKVEFVPGGNQPGAVLPAPKVSMPTAVAAGSGLPSGPTAVDNNIVRDGRQNKKSKWDKVDSDRRNPLPAGSQHSLSAAGAHTVILSAANAGTGYTAFQQKRRETEEKKSSEKRLDRRS